MSEISIIHSSFVAKINNFRQSCPSVPYKKFKLKGLTKTQNRKIKILNFLILFLNISSGYAKILGETNFQPWEIPRSGSKAKDEENKTERW